jgi:tetratricopeptide (TPR) repeat protein
MGKSRCSICLREPYCSSECQKLDWKAHKSICKTLKNLSNKPEPYSHVGRTIVEICKPAKKVSDVRILCHLLSYAEFQFGDRVLGKAYRERENGERISNWDAEVVGLHSIHERVIAIYLKDTSLSQIQCDSLALPHSLKTVELLRPWSISLDSDASLDKEQINFILILLSDSERIISDIRTSKKQFSLAEDHLKRALSYVKRYEGEAKEKTERLLSVLKDYCNLRGRQGDYPGALSFAEEAYNCAAEAYNPVHPEVQVAAGALIQCLTHTGNFKDAETFAQMTLDSLRDPANKMDQEGEQVGFGYYNLANVIDLLDNDDPKAEKFAREALRIRIKFYGSGHVHVGQSIGLLSNILLKQNNFGDETKRLLEQYLANGIRNEGPEGMISADANNKFGHYHDSLSEMNQPIGAIKNHLVLSKSYYKEALRIIKKTNGLHHPNAIKVQQSLSAVSMKLSALD